MPDLNRYEASEALIPARPGIASCAVATALRASPLACNLSDPALHTIAAQAHIRKLPQSEAIYRAGDDSHDVYVVVEGEVKVSRGGDEGISSLLEVLSVGGMFGDLSYFDPGPRTATVTAVRDTTLAVLNYEQLGSLLSDNPATAVPLLQSYASRLRRTNEAISDLVLLDAKGRVAKALLELAAQFGTGSGDGLYVDHGLSQQDLARYVGISREFLNRILADYESRGWVSIRTRSITVLNQRELRKRY